MAHGKVRSRSAGAWPWLVVIVGLGVATAPLVGAANDETDVAQLKAIGKQVSEVVTRVMPACVAVTDGMGFGSGVIVSEDGLVLTAAHVILENSRYELILPSGQTVRAKPLGRNLNIDAGMLQIVEPGPWPHVELGPQQRPAVGSWVVSLGHSGGYELGRTPPVRTGRLLRRGKNQLFTDAVLIGGDSGGPLFNLNGQLIGIHSSIGDTIAQNRHVALQGFRDDWDRLKSGETWGQLPELEAPDKTRRRGIIGVRLDLEADRCRIRIVNEDSPAEEAGIEPGDIVVSFDSMPIRDGQHLIDVIRRHNAGDVCPIVILRNDVQIEFEIQLQ